MKKYLFYFSIVVLKLSGCGCDPDIDFSFDQKHQRLSSPYHLEDTIYFSNETGMRDTILIAEIEKRINNCTFNTTSVNIKHLPKNRWLDGYEGRGGKLVPLNQTLISVSKNADERYYYVGIHYRDFYGEITDSTEVKYDTLFNYCNQDKYMVITNERSEFERYKTDSLLIMKIFWTDRYGLSGYELRNGKILKREL